jgi:CHAT domain-containing protein/tetratricopeptide (TPR) repeat protein
MYWRFLRISGFLLPVMLMAIPLLAAPDPDRLARADSLLSERAYAAAAEQYVAVLAVTSEAAGRSRILRQLAECAYGTGDYQAAVRYAEQAVDLAGDRGELLAGARTSYGKVLSRLGDYAQAKTVLRQANEFWRRDPEQYAKEFGGALVMLSYAHLLRDELPEAEATAREAIAVLEQHLGPDSPELASAHNSLGNLLYRRGDIAGAQAAYAASLAIRQRVLSFPDVRIGASYYSLGRLLARQGRTLAAIEEYRRALEHYEAVDADHPRVGDAYLALGEKVVTAGDYRTGRDYFLRALGIFRRAFGEKQERVGTVYNKLADIYRRNGDFVQARIYAERGLDVTRAAVGDRHDRVASGLTTVGDIEADAGNFGPALTAYRAALDIRREVLGDDHVRTAFLYFQIGQAEREAGRPAAALPALERSVAIYRQAGMEGTEDISDLYAVLGRTYIDLGNLDRARVFLDRDQRILRSYYGDTHPYLANSYANLSHWYECHNDLDSALLLQQAALRAMSPAYRTTDLHVAPELAGLLSPYETLELLRRKGDLLAQRSAAGDREAALAHYERAAELVDRLRGRYRSQGAKLFFQREADPVYAAGFREAYRRYEETGAAQWLATAFRFAERSKAGLLTATLQGVADRSFAGVPDSLRATAEGLRARLAGMEQLIMDEHLWPVDSTGAQLRDLRRRQVALQSSYDSLLAVIETRYPAFYDLRYAVQQVDPAAVQVRLPDRRTVLLEYFLTDSLLYTFAISRSAVRVTSQPWRPAYAQDIQRLRRAPDRDRWLADPRAETRDYLAASARLHAVLIEPLLAKGDYDRLVIVPHGVLAYVPFAGLAPAVTDDFRQADFLLRRYAIQYANSATLWATAPPRQQSRSTELLGMAPSFAEVLAEAPVVDAPVFREALTPLRYSAREVAAAHEYFPGASYTGAAATERVFKTQAPTAGILHLATHAQVSDSLPLQSRLLFASATSDTSEDHALYAYELYNLRFDAELAVLSACNTGFGRLQAGEGVLSLAHAFRYAGARSIVMSLWPAEDAGTAQILTAFYAELAAGEPKDVALRRARLAYLATADPVRAHPYYWTHLVALGDMQPLPRSRYGYGIAGGILGLLLLIWGWRWYSARDVNLRNVRAAEPPAG